MADTADHRVQNQFLFTAPYISMARLYTKMATVFRNYVLICTRNDVIENALYKTLGKSFVGLYLEPCNGHSHKKEARAKPQYVRTGIATF